MSYDVTITKDGSEVFWRNYTSNTSKMLYDHFPNNEGIHCLLGKTGSEAAPLFAHFWNSLNEQRHQIGDASQAHMYDAPNGWGHTIGTLIFIGEIQAACACYPDEIIHLSA